MTAFIPNIVGAVVPTTWAVMWLIMPVLLFKAKIELTIAHWLGLIFLGYASLSCLWSPHGAYDLLGLFALASVFIWAATLKNLRTVVIGLSIGLAVSAIIAISQYFGFNWVFLVTAKPAGLFVNSNVFAEISGMVLLLLITYKLWWFLPVTIPGLLVSSRAVILGLGLTGLVWVWSKSKALAVSIAGISLATVYTLTENYGSVYQRFDIWRDTISGFTLFGHGIGSFPYLFPLYAKHIDMLIEHPNEAHNDLLQMIFELGIGAIPFVIMTFLLLRVNNAHKYPLIFFIIISMFGFPLHIPVSAFMAAIVAGYLAQHSLDGSYISNYFRSVLPSRLSAQKFG